MKQLRGWSFTSPWLRIGTMRRWLPILAFNKSVVAMHSPRLGNEYSVGVSDAAMALGGLAGAISDRGDIERGVKFLSESDVGQSGENQLEAQATVARAAKLLDAEADEEFDTAVAMEDAVAKTERSGVHGTTEQFRRTSRRLLNNAQKARMSAHDLRMEARLLLNEGKRVPLWTRSYPVEFDERSVEWARLVEPLANSTSDGDDLISSANSLFAQAKALRKRQVKRPHRTKSQVKQAISVAGNQEIADSADASMGQGAEFVVEEKKRRKREYGDNDVENVPKKKERSGCEFPTPIPTTFTMPPTPVPRPTPKPVETPAPTKKPTPKPTAKPTPSPTPQMPPQGCPFAGKPLWLKAPFSDCNGTCGKMTASRICAFIGMVKSPKQDETEEKHTAENVSAIWKMGSCSDYVKQKLPKIIERTANSVTYCMLSFPSAQSHTVWRKLKCDCPPPPPPTPCPTKKPCPLVACDVPPKCIGDLTRTTVSMKRKIDRLSKKIHAAKTAEKHEEVSALAKKQKRAKELLKKTRRERRRVKASRLVVQGLKDLRHIVKMATNSSEKTSPKKKTLQELKLAKEEKEEADDWAKKRDAYEAEQVLSLKLANLALSQPMRSKSKAKLMSLLKMGTAQATKGIKALKEACRAGTKNADSAMAKAKKDMAKYGVKDSTGTAKMKAAGGQKSKTNVALSILEESARRTTLQPDNCIVKADQEEELANGLDAKESAAYDGYYAYTSTVRGSKSDARKLGLAKYAAGISQPGSVFAAYINTCVTNKGGSPSQLEQEVKTLGDCQKLCRGVKGCVGLAWRAAGSITEANTCKLSVARNWKDKSDNNGHM
eukprot:TRINITY_DN64226_c0_g1_i1.p1 TRINITY_DN64226_c0_g1~~TRINITY_DN64226_c0_g1_i1.p1  ORF type:complete len:831 (-),score=177.60 TRINITY_DN64226_c0_g1_i1:35-2527(-)